jgi:hypothetical protein
MFDLAAFLVPACLGHSTRHVFGVRPELMWRLLFTADQVVGDMPIEVVDLEGVT